MHQLVARNLHLGKAGGTNAQLKVPPLIAEMIAGADSIDATTDSENPPLQRPANGNLYVGFPGGVP